jgi:hypothetical protein
MHSTVATLVSSQSQTELTINVTPPPLELAHPSAILTDTVCSQGRPTYLLLYLLCLCDVCV